MIEWIRDGVMPTEILRELAEREPDLTALNLSEGFSEMVGHWSWEMSEAIWHWRRGTLADDEVNEIVLKELREAGLI